MIPHRTDAVYKLYKDGMIEKLLVTGGIGFLNPDRNTPEAMKKRKYLLGKLVPDSNIIVEDKSRNSIENIANSV